MLSVQKLAFCKYAAQLVMAGTAGQVLVLELSDVPSKQAISLASVDPLQDREGFTWKDPRRVQPVAFGTSHGFGLFDYPCKSPGLATCTLHPNDSPAMERPLSQRWTHANALSLTYDEAAWVLAQAQDLQGGRRAHRVGGAVQGVHAAEGKRQDEVQADGPRGLSRAQAGPRNATHASCRLPELPKLRQANGTLGIVLAPRSRDGSVFSPMSTNLATSDDTTLDTTGDVTVEDVKDFLGPVEESEKNRRTLAEDRA
ncbi:hypothetical protein J1605_011198 [Eschrichtius robustus]|uniref:Uncharacterized protein n=1 Tax=Eschrichtius robustus TaxID=9764 RepID=A0AB34GNW8_ESCRO|nr:hypothetical protein J1605_011198 [Eschrichtius robustus]